MADISSLYPQPSQGNNNPMQMLQGVASAANAMQDLKNKQFDLRLKQLNLLHQDMAALLSSPGLTKQMVQDRMLDRVKEGVLPASIMAQEMGRINDNNVGDVLKGHLNNILDAEQSLTRVYGTQPGLVDTGGGLRMMGTNRVNPDQAYQGPLMPKATVPVTTQNAPPGALPTASNTNPAQLEAQAGASKAGTDLWQKETMELANRNAVLNPLEKVIPLLDELGQTGTGVGTQNWQDVKSRLLGMGIDLGEKVTDATTLKGALEKYLNQIPRTAGDVHSVEHLAQAIGGSPNMNLPKGANRMVALTQLALQKQKLALTAEWNAQHPNATAINPATGLPYTATYAQETAEMAKNSDPRAFALDLMSPKARNLLLAELKAKAMAAHKTGKIDPEVENFLESQRIAKDNNFLNSHIQTIPAAEDSPPAPETKK